MVANDTTLLYTVAPLTGSGEASVAVGFTRTLVAGPLGEAFTLGEVLFTSPLHMFCSQHVASHFSKVSSGCRCEALQDFAWRSWHSACIKIEIRKEKINYSNGRKELFLEHF